LCPCVGAGSVEVIHDGLFLDEEDDSAAAAPKSKGKKKKD